MARLCRIRADRRRRGPGWPGGGFYAAGARFATLVACNLAFVFAASLALSDRADFQLGAGVFFSLLITLIIWLYSVYEPVHDVRFDRTSA